MSLKQPTGELILVVDDDEMIRQMAELNLSEAGYSIAQASNGREALEIFDQSEQMPAMVLLDVLMPHLNGFETCWELRQRVRDMRLPILMLTGLDDVESVDLAFQAGATDFISKPINWALLIQRVRYALRDRDMFLDLEEKQQRLTHAQQLAKLGYGKINLTTGMIDFSPEIADMLGVSSESLIHSDDFFSLLAEDDRRAMKQALQEAMEGDGQYNFEHRLVLPGQAEKVILQQGEISRQGDEVLVVGTLQNITELTHAEEMVHFHTYYDQLTDLPNRILFEKQLNERLGGQDIQAVLFVGLDRFKSVNDSLGHAGGDKLLKVIAKRLSVLQKEAMLVAHFSGDTFSLYLPSADSVAEVNELAQSLLEMVSAPVTVGAHSLEMNASIGIALYPLEADSAERLLLGADTALNLAKRKGGAQYRYFSSEMDGLAQERLMMEQALREASKLDQFELYYQPQIDARSQEIVGVEALIRWNHPSMGLVLPSKFISLAEDTGLIIPGEWVLRTACCQARSWLDAGIKVRVGVNLSAKQLQLDGFHGLVASVLEGSGLPPEQLDLEITESMAIADLSNTITVLEKIRRLGVLTSMDDFGTGYSSLSYLQKLPLHTLKIDRAFIKDIKAGGENSEIARAIITLAHSVGLHVIAEGIETRSQYEQLLMNGCNEIQGFFFCKPVPAAEFEQIYLRSRGHLYANDLGDYSPE